MVFPGVPRIHAENGIELRGNKHGRGCVRVVCFYKVLTKHTHNIYTTHTRHIHNTNTTYTRHIHNTNTHSHNACTIHTQHIYTTHAPTHVHAYQPLPPPSGIGVARPNAGSTPPARVHRKEIYLTCVLARGFLIARGRLTRLNPTDVCPSVIMRAILSPVL